ncbi:MAG: pilus assembly protein TadG-related protein, partial [Pirellulaceae bacterium]
MRAVNTSKRGWGASARNCGPKRRGNVIVLSAFLMIVMMAMVALAVDVGYMYTMQAQLQRAVDSAALAGAADLAEGLDQAQAKAKEYLVRNPVGSSTSVISEAFMADAMADFDEDHAEHLQLQAGEWNPETRQFEETESLPSSLRVAMEYPNLPLFFGRVLGKDSFSVRAESTAMFQPRDIMIVLDYSASMNDDSEFSAFGKLGQSEVESNLADIYADLGSPVYGNLGFAPQWAVAQGVPEDIAAQIPHVSVEYQYSSVRVTSTQPLDNVKIEFSNGYQQNFSSSGNSATFSGSGGNAGKQVRKVWVKSWGNTAEFGSNGEYFSFTSSGINDTIKKAIGLDGVAYP